jgi:hypothetical protein
VLAGLVEVRGGAALVHARHLPGEVLEVGRRASGGLSGSLANPSL